MAKTLYWVGGSGDISSPSHWSESINGVGGIDPTLFTDARLIFNDYSGIENISINLDKAIKCDSFTVTRTKNIIFTGSVNWFITKEININSVITIPKQGTLTCSGSVKLNLKEKTALTSILEFETIQSNFGSISILTNLTTGVLSAKNLNANNVNIKTSSFIIDGVIQLEDSKLITDNITIVSSALGEFTNSILDLTNENGYYNINSLQVKIDTLKIGTGDYTINGGFLAKRLLSAATSLKLSSICNVKWIDALNELTISSSTGNNIFIECNNQDIIADVILINIIPLNGSISKSEVMYWIGGSGNFQDGSHWSLTDGGTAINKTPSSNTICKITDLSSSDIGFEISLTTQISIFSFLDETSTKKLKLNGDGVSTLSFIKDITLQESNDNSDSNIMIKTILPIVEKTINIEGYNIKSIILNGEKININKSLKQKSSNIDDGIIINENSTILNINDCSLTGSINFGMEDTIINTTGLVEFNNNSTSMSFIAKEVVNKENVKVKVLSTLETSSNSILINAELYYVEFESCYDTVAYTLKGEIEELIIKNPTSQTMKFTSNTFIEVNHLKADGAKIDTSGSLGATIIIPETHVFLYNSFSSGVVSIQRGRIISNQKLILRTNEVLHLEADTTYLLTDLLIPASVTVDMHGGSNSVLDLNGVSYTSNFTIPTGLIITNGTLETAALVTLRDENGKNIYPETYGTNVILDSGKTLNEELDDNFGRLFGKGIKDIYVDSVNGVDTNKGEQVTPLRTLGQALLMIPSSSSILTTIHYIGSNEVDIGGSIGSLYSINNCNLKIELTDITISELIITANGKIVFDMNNSKIKNLKILNSNLHDNNESQNLIVDTFSSENSSLVINTIQSESTLNLKNTTMEVDEVLLSAYTLTGMFDLINSIVKVKTATTIQTVPYIAKLDHTSRIIYN